MLCFNAAVQAYLTYPETARKSIKEIEMLFSKGGPKSWKTILRERGWRMIEEFRGMQREGKGSIGEVAHVEVGKEGEP